MKHLHMSLLLLCCLLIETSGAIVSVERAPTNPSEHVPIHVLEAVTNSCMSMALHQYYTASVRRPQSPKALCTSPTNIMDSGSSGVFWLQGSSVNMPIRPFIDKTLKIGVPLKNGFNEFMKVEKSPTENHSRFSGFPVDVFNAVMNMLPYQVPYDFFLYNASDEDSPDYYDSLITQVYLKEYDAVVGDISITANRSDFVDFTYEYMESGVSMVVPVADDDTSSPWWFLEPLTTDLWVTTFALAVLKGVLVWFFEHRDNSDFQGSPLEVVGKTLFFSFSVFVFANAAKLKNNYSKSIMNVWTFVVFVLVTSYGANLTSILTVERLKPTITDIDQLKRSDCFVGCQKGSFVHELLTKKFGFKESKIKLYATAEEYADALSRGNDNNGVAAVVDEIPYIKVFLKNHCRNYTQSQWTYRTGGFGFAFPRGSALLPDISRAVLNFSEGDEMLNIERKWFGDQTTCPDSDNPVSNKRLRLHSLRSIYIIAGAATALALVIFLMHNFYKTSAVGFMGRLTEKGFWQSFLTLHQHSRQTQSQSHNSHITP